MLDVVVVDVVFASAIWVACESIASKIKARAATPAETMGASAILPVVLLLFAESVPKWCRCHQLGCQGMEKKLEDAHETNAPTMVGTLVH